MDFTSHKQLFRRYNSISSSQKALFFYPLPVDIKFYKYKCVIEIWNIFNISLTNWSWFVAQQWPTRFSLLYDTLYNWCYGVSVLRTNTISVYCKSYYYTTHYTINYHSNSRNNLSSTTNHKVCRPLYTRIKLTTTAKMHMFYWSHISLKCIMVNIYSNDKFLVLSSHQIKITEIQQESL